jgi:hypothetical protein
MVNAIDSREVEPGPLYIQGDHTGGMKWHEVSPHHSFGAAALI